jgi:hypothetical protein
MSYIGRTPQIGAYHKLDSITCDGSTAYTMQLDSANFVPESVNHLIVSVNGVIQAPTDSFTVSSSTITFASALSSSDTIDFIMALGNVLDIGVPSDATISASKLATTSITGQTAETSANDSDSLLIYDDSATALRKMTRANFLTGVGGSNTPSFLAYRNTGQSVSGATATKVQFNAEVYDTDNKFDTSTYKFTPTESGKYFLFAQCNIQAIHDQATTEFDIRKNDSTVLSRVKHIALNSSSDRNPSMYTSCIVDSDTDDYFTVQIYTDFGSGTTITGQSFPSNPIYTQFGGYKLIGA